MGIDLEFKQIPFCLIEKLKEAPQAINLFVYAECSESVIQEDLQLLENTNLSSDYLEYLEEDDRLELWKWVLENLKNHSEDYRKVEKDINDIIEEGKKHQKLELDRIWTTINFLLTGEISNAEVSLVKNKKFQKYDFPKINAILGGTETKCESTYGYIRYLNPEQVKEIADALSKFSEERIREQIKKLDIFLEEYIINFLLKQYNLMTEYYQDAALKENAMLLYLT